MSCNPATTPSTVFYDVEDSSDSPASRFDFPVAASTETRMTKSATTAPVAIPGTSGPRRQRHTNFTPPRSYLGNVEKHMVRSKSAGSLSTAVSFLVTEHVHPNQFGSQGDIEVGSANKLGGSTSHFMSEFTSKSVPNFKRCVLEQGIGLELRGISDNFYLEFSGFLQKTGFGILLQFLCFMMHPVFCDIIVYKGFVSSYLQDGGLLVVNERHGYNFVHSSTRVYPSSYPGCSRHSGVGSSWQGVVTKIAPGKCHKGDNTTDHFHQASTATDCCLFPGQFD